MSKRLLLCFALFGAACSAGSPASMTLNDLPSPSTDVMLVDIKKLSSDEFEGRMPGSKGEALTLEYLVKQLKDSSLEPGAPNGEWLQKVSLVGLTPQAQGPFVVTKGAAKKAFKPNDEVVAFSRHVADEAKIENSELVFVGYGVQAPEQQWDDFRGIDVKGKTIVVLVNDPPVTKAGSSDLDDKVFGGKAMTYYGRWTYKYEEATEKGAAAIFIVHETATAGYPYEVVGAASRANSST